MSCYFNHKQIQKYGGYQPPKDPSKEPSAAWKIGFSLIALPTIVVAFVLLVGFLWVFGPIIFFVLLGFMIYAAFQYNR